MRWWVIFVLGRVWSAPERVNLYRGSMSFSYYLEDSVDMELVIGGRNPNSCLKCEKNSTEAQIVPLSIQVPEEDSQILALEQNYALEILRNSVNLIALHVTNALRFQRLRQVDIEPLEATPFSFLLRQGQKTFVFLFGEKKLTILRVEFSRINPRLSLVKEQKSQIDHRQIVKIAHLNEVLLVMLKDHTIQIMAMDKHTLKLYLLKVLNHSTFFPELNPLQFPHFRITDMQSGESLWPFFSEESETSSSPRFDVVSVPEKNSTNSSDPSNIPPSPSNHEPSDPSSSNSSSVTNSTDPSTSSPVNSTSLSPSNSTASQLPKKKFCPLKKPKKKKVIVVYNQGNLNATASKLANKKRKKTKLPNLKQIKRAKKNAKIAKFKTLLKQNKSLSLKTSKKSSAPPRNLTSIRPKKNSTSPKKSSGVKRPSLGKGRGLEEVETKGEGHTATDLFDLCIDTQDQFVPQLCLRLHDGCFSVHIVEPLESRDRSEAKLCLYPILQRGSVLQSSMRLLTSVGVLKTLPFKKDTYSLIKLKDKFFLKTKSEQIALGSRKPSIIFAANVGKANVLVLRNRRELRLLFCVRTTRTKEIIISSKIASLKRKEEVQSFVMDIMGDIYIFVKSSKGKQLYKVRFGTSSVHCVLENSLAYVFGCKERMRFKTLKLFSVLNTEKGKKMKYARSPSFTVLYNRINLEEFWWFWVVCLTLSFVAFRARRVELHEKID